MMIARIGWLRVDVGRLGRRPLLFLTSTTATESCEARTDAEQGEGRGFGNGRKRKVIDR